MKPWTITNAWREIIMRVFSDFARLENNSPEWMINPGTHRHLKFDYYFPKIAVAIRFEGLPSRERKSRLSLEEEIQQEQRKQARALLCEQHAVELLTLDVMEGDPVTILKEMAIMLSRVHRSITISKRIDPVKAELVEKLAEARATLTNISLKVCHLPDLGIYAELWKDRFYAVINSENQPVLSQPSYIYEPGMAVIHHVYGNGEIVNLEDGKKDCLVTVHFENGGQKTFIANLVYDKLKPRE